MHQGRASRFFCWFLHRVFGSTMGLCHEEHVEQFTRRYHFGNPAPEGAICRAQAFMMLGPVILGL